MKIEEAIQRLKTHKEYISPHGRFTEEAIDMAIEALEKQKQKDEVRVGDEVKITEGDSLCVVCGIVGGTADLIFEKGGLGQFPVDKLIRTGRHFDELEELLRKVKED